MVRPYSSNETGRKIKNALVELQPEHKQEFEKTLQRLQTKFTDLDDGFKADCSERKNERNFSFSSPMVTGNNDTA